VFSQLGMQPAFGAAMPLPFIRECCQAHDAQPMAVGLLSAMWTPSREFLASNLQSYFYQLVRKCAIKELPAAGRIHYKFNSKSLHCLSCLCGIWADVSL